MRILPVEQVSGHLWICFPVIVVEVNLSRVNNDVRACRVGISRCFRVLRCQRIRL